MHAPDAVPLSTLRARWRDRAGSEPPPTWSARFLSALLAYEHQADRCGRLSPAHRRRLQRLATSKGPRPAALSLKPGGRLVHEWRGTTHVVDVIDAGFVWNTRRYRSLSAIALAITGTKRSGPQFFGLARATR